MPQGEQCGSWSVRPGQPLSQIGYRRALVGYCPTPPDNVANDMQCGVCTMELCNLPTSIYHFFIHTMAQYTKVLFSLICNFIMEPYHITIKAGREQVKFCQLLKEMQYTSFSQLSVLTVQVSVGMKNNSVWRYAHWKPHKGFTFVVTSYSYQSKYSKYCTRDKSSVQILFGKLVSILHNVDYMTLRFGTSLSSVLAQHVRHF